MLVSTVLILVAIVWLNAFFCNNDFGFISLHLAYITPTLSWWRKNIDIFSILSSEFAKFLDIFLDA